MFIFRAFIVLILSWVISADGFAATTGKPGGIVVLEGLKETFKNAVEDYGLQQVIAEKALRAIITLKKPGSIRTAAKAAPQSSQVFKLMKNRTANSYEKTLYMEWFMLASLADVNIGKILDEGRQAATGDAIYTKHMRACYKLSGLINGVNRGDIQPVSGIMTPPDGGIYDVVSIGPKYSYFDNDLDPGIVGQGYDVVAAQQGAKNCKTGFLKFFDNVKADFYLNRVFQKSPICILGGVNYRPSYFSPSKKAGFPPADAGTPCSEIILNAHGVAPVQIDTDGQPWPTDQQFAFSCDGPFLAAASSPFEESDVKSRSLEKTPAEYYPLFRPYIIFRANYAHDRNLFFKNDTYSFTVNPIGKDAQGALINNGISLSGANFKYILNNLDGKSIFATLTDLGGNRVAFASHKSTPLSSVLLLQIDPVALNEVPPRFSGSSQPLAIGTGAVNTFVDGPPGVTYLFEKNHKGKSLVHILLKPSLEQMPAITFKHVDLLDFTLTSSRNLIAVGRDANGNTVVDIITVNKTPEGNWGVKQHTINDLGKMNPMPRMFYFPPLSHDKTGSITFAGPEGVMAIRGIPESIS